MLRWLLALVPLAGLLGHIVHPPPVLTFVTAAAAVAVLAEWMRRATEQIAIRAGGAIGGLLNVSFGSAAEFILMLFVVASGQIEVVRAQITGSVLATSLLGLGLGCLLGGWKRKKQTYSSKRAGLLSSLFLMVVLALLLPHIFDQANISHAATGAQRRATDESFSIGVSVVLLLVYCGNLVFTLVTHRDVFAGAEDETRQPDWSMTKSVVVLVVATAAVAFCAELVSGALEASAQMLRLPILFLGLVPLALVGTAADLFASVSFARQDRMDLVMTISIGSAIQIGLVVAPLLVLCSFFMGHPMSLVFPSLLNLFAITGAAFIVNAVASDGETNWFEGLLLIGVYILLALAFLFVTPAQVDSRGATSSIIIPAGSVVGV